jgi:plasmid replication initiation protein
VVPQLGDPEGPVAWGPFLRRYPRERKEGLLIYCRRKHGGKQRGGWAFTFRQLYEKSGSLARFSDFAIDLRKIVARQSIPEYWLSIYRNGHEEECLHFIRRSRLPLGHEGAPGIEMRKRRTMPRLAIE